MTVARIFLGLGSNMGDRRAALDRAERELDVSETFQIVARSGDHDTAPLGPPQPRFLNRVVEGRSDVSPIALLGVMQRIEVLLGRDLCAERWGPRPIDLDLLAWGDLVLDSDGLTIPHVEIAHRSFVLEPWAEIAPEFVVARLDVTVRTLRDQLRERERGVGC